VEKTKEERKAGEEAEEERKKICNSETFINSSSFYIVRKVDINSKILITTMSKRIT
jgi:hypothetical protein